MPKLIFIFLDGVGIGRASKTNPFFAADVDYLCFYENGLALPDKTPITTIDARLGIEGIPMSATGQTSLFTGINMPRILNEHKDSYPDKLMRKVIKENNIFSRLKKERFNVQFLNAYPDCSHFYTSAHVRIGDDGELRFSSAFQYQFRSTLSVTTCMMLSSHMLPFSEKDILRERALYHDFSNESLIQKGSHLPRFTPEKAAEIIFNTSRNYDMVLYEFFQTDMFGHGFEIDECIDLIRKLNRLVKRLISFLNKEEDTLLITSDHGNLEDTTTQFHTTNPVPLIAWGRKSDELRDNIKKLIDVTPVIVNFFK